MDHGTSQGGQAHDGPRDRDGGQEPTRRHLEDELRQARKMEALGQLAGGMALDLSNLLTVTLAHVDLLEEGLDGGDLERARQDLREIRRTTTTSSRMIKHLLSFSRGERLRLHPVMLGAVVRDAMRLVRPLLPPGVEVAMDLGEEAREVLADPSAVEKILLTLATNARDAMPGEGRLEIRAGSRTLDEEHLARTGWGDPGDYGVLTVRDTGRGMPPETVARLFRPFFTVRQEDEEIPAGLSMSMVYGLMKQHRGYIEVESEPGRGTTVRLYFRLAGARLRQDPDARAPGRSEAGKTILFVEDDEDLLQVACRILRAHGYRVVEAGNGLEALELTEREGLPDLIVTDLVMPGMTGIELLHRLEERGGLPPVLLTSGFRPEFLLDWHRDPSGFPFLEKPWSMEALLGEVRALTREATASS
jgi:CheY-like chemotaxis protein